MGTVFLLMTLSQAAQVNVLAKLLRDVGTVRYMHVVLKLCSLTPDAPSAFTTKFATNQTRSQVHKGWKHDLQWKRL